MDVGYSPRNDGLSNGEYIAGLIMCGAADATDVAGDRCSQFDNGRAQSRIIGDIDIDSGYDRCFIIADDYFLRGRSSISMNVSSRPGYDRFPYRENVTGLMG